MEGAMRKISFMKLRRFSLTSFFHWSLLLYVFLIPWRARWIFTEYSVVFPFYGDLSLYITDILFVIVFALWGVFAYKNRKSVMQKVKKHKWIWIFVFLFLVYSALSILWSPVQEVSLYKALRLLQVGIFGLVLATSALRSRALYLVIIAGGLVQGLWALEQFFLQIIPASTVLGIAEQNPIELGVSVIEYLDQRWLRAYGSLSHPNMLGGFLALAGIVVSGWFFSAYEQMSKFIGKWEEVTVAQLKPIRWQILASLSGFIFVLLGLFLSFSRSAWLGFSIGWAILFLAVVIKSKKGNRKLFVLAGAKLILTGVVLFGALNFIFGPLWATRIQGENRLAQVSATERSSLFEEAKTIIHLHPFLGVGIGAYEAVLMDLYPDKPIYTYQPVHNTWLLLWAELGIIGILLFFCWLALLLEGLKRLVDKNRRIRIDQAILFACIISIGLIAYFEHFFWTLPFGLLLVGVFYFSTMREE